LLKEVRVQIYETGQVLRAASKMQMTGIGPDPYVGHIAAQVIIWKSGLSDSPEDYVLIALVKQPDPPETPTAMMKLL
jgi:hypothetical protein